ncbi:immunoglobulin-like domain-containing protein [Chitinophaga sp.]|uniref:immunoglobulin-like domain-containing protein n=1 Tax=Chitinophaga sp. TaxID=1869181 RepID=UPI002F93D3A4
MKALYIFLAGAMLLSACSKNSEDVYTKMVTPTFPTITLKGDPVVTLSVGGTYTDAGATGYDSITKVSTELTPLSNNVDPANAGFYVVSFLTKNVYGYRTSADRLVLVTTISPSDDISGSYKRVGNNEIVHVVKAGTGLYTIDNVGGVAGAPAPFVFPYYIGFPDENTFEGPSQNTPLGGLSLSNTSITRSGANITLKYVVINPNFGTAVRTFERQ